LTLQDYKDLLLNIRQQVIETLVQEAFKEDYQYHVDCRVTIKGQLVLPADDKGKPAAPLDVTGSSVIQYDERVLEIGVVQLHAGIEDPDRHPVAGVARRAGLVVVRLDSQDLHPVLALDGDRAARPTPRPRRAVLDAHLAVDAGLAHLRALTGLEELDVNSEGVTDAGLAHLEKLTDLSDLRLNGTGVTDSGLAHLAGLKGLGFLRLSNTMVTDAGIRQISRSLPHVKMRP